MYYVSLIMVLISSYLTAGVMSPKDERNRPYGPAPFLYTLLTMFAQVVLTFEILSLFKAIKEINVLAINLVFVIVSLILWVKKDKPLYIPAVKEKFNQIWNTLKHDKIMLAMGIGFVFMLIVVILLDAFLPVTGGDALTYHLNRASYWMHQGSLNHFAISDDRNLVMPINSEILYLWNLLFFKNDIGLYYISFIGYIASIFSIYNILEYFKFSRKRILWTIFILSAFASVIVEITSLETDVLIAGLVLPSITLFLYALKERKVSMLFYSALAYALAMGTKSPAVIAFPGAFLLMSYFAYQKEKKEFYKPLLAYLFFLFITFMIFSSYNYILNFIDFGNPLGSESARTVHGFRGGIKAFVANYIKYIFMLFDFSGFRYSEYVGEHIINAREAVLTFLQIPPDLGVEMSDNNEINNRLLNVKAGAGILGFLIFLPALCTSLIMGITRRNNKKVKVISAFAVMFLINIMCMSFSIAYMVYSIRFLTFLILISTPVLAITYIKKTNIIKLLILFFVLSYYFIISTNLQMKNVSDILATIKRSKNLSSAREQIRCSVLVKFYGTSAYCYLRDYIRKMPEGTSIALFPNYVDETYVVDMLNSHGYKIETLLPENAPNYNYEDYDYIITTKKDYIISNNLLHKTADIKTDYRIGENGVVYVKNPDFHCIYITTDNNKYFLSSMKDKTVKTANCRISENFFNDRGFALYGTFDFYNPLPRYQNYVRIYKNILEKN